MSTLAKSDPQAFARVGDSFRMRQSAVVGVPKDQIGFIQPDGRIGDRPNDAWDNDYGVVDWLRDNIERPRTFEKLMNLNAEDRGEAARLRVDSITLADAKWIDTPQESDYYTLKVTWEVRGVVADNLGPIAIAILVTLAIAAVATIIPSARGWIREFVTEFAEIVGGTVGAGLKAVADPVADSFVWIAGAVVVIVLAIVFLKRRGAA